MPNLICKIDPCTKNNWNFALQQIRKDLPWSEGGEQGQADPAHSYMKAKLHFEMHMRKELEKVTISLPKDNFQLSENYIWSKTSELPEGLEREVVQTRNSLCAKRNLPTDVLPSAHIFPHCRAQ